MRRDGEPGEAASFLIGAYNSRRFFAWCERALFSTPYQFGDVDVSIGPVAHAVGVGLRVDTTWLGLIERTSVRFDIATSLVGNAPVQFWLGIQHLF